MRTFAERWFSGGAKHGDAESQYYLALLYYEGVSVSQDYKKAAHWFRKAAEGGFAYADYIKGWMYHQGVRRNPKKATFWLRKAAKTGRRPDARTLLKEIADGIRRV